MCLASLKQLNLDSYVCNSDGCMRAKLVIINEYVALILANEPNRSMYVMFKAPGMYMLTGWITNCFDTT